jgi:proteic killer suppression protein
MIASFGDKVTEDLFHGRQTRRVQGVPAEILPAVLRKLDMLNAANALQDLRSPPGNRLEKLSGGLKGFHSVRVNDQWRLVFRWESSEAHQVSLTDYH